MSNNKIIAEILAGNRIIDRHEKLQRTVDVMIENHQKKAKQRELVISNKTTDARGYGQHRYMGD